jgi:hypothetical protein
MVMGLSLWMREPTHAFTKDHRPITGDSNADGPQLLGAELADKAMDKRPGQGRNKQAALARPSEQERNRAPHKRFADRRNTQWEQDSSQGPCRQRVERQIRECGVSAQASQRRGQ